ncbi:DegV family protein [Phocicoccus pinnipedialis]|uniref:DegV domain-containing protein n=1 Tax=Phocicoccus pinnipedialis TaxID=110845 RepID=A0A6V7R0B9_9BACL|nr:DegV family protein [Jeotgalicoccus pinnipedialis]MBP1938777.1 DegV family protein with EDD domain [Jeotgalicoccus pinnipedialis]CAD2070769.1 DegV domain-containing protein [Jeotgalicoccus pinnipedialis]
MKVAIVVDSTAYLSEEIKKQNNIYSISLNTIFGEDTYREGKDITTEEFYEKMRGFSKLPNTSQPSIGDYILLLEELNKDGYTDVISLHLSAEISGTCQNALAAAKSVEGINVHVVDSEIACTPLGLLALYAAQNKDIKPIDELLEELNTLKQKNHMNSYFIVNDLTNLQKGGRLSNAQAFLGGILRIKPILKFENGKIIATEKIRTMKKAQDKVIQLVKSDYDADGHHGKDMIMTVIHGNDEASADAWIAQLKEDPVFSKTTFIKSYFGPVIGTHLGEEAIGITFADFDVDLTGF